MSALFVRTVAVTAIAAAVDLTGKEGYFYKRDANGNAVLCDAATDRPDGVILDGAEAGKTISAAPAGGNHGTVLVKLGAAVVDLRKDLTIRADSTAEPDDAAGARVIVARPLELGVADEKIECILIYPVSFAA